MTILQYIHLPTRLSYFKQIRSRSVVKKGITTSFNNYHFANSGKRWGIDQLQTYLGNNKAVYFMLIALVTKYTK